MINKKTLIKPYIQQFYKGNEGRFVLALSVTFVMTAATMMISWLVQVIIDMATGADVGFSFIQVVLLTILSIFLEAFAYFLAYHSKPRFISKAIGQYKDYVYERLCQKGIGAFSSENSSLYISALSNDAAICLGALTLMFFYSPLLTILSILLAFLPLVVSISTGNLVAKAEKNVSDKNETYMSTLKDSLIGFSVIKSFRAEGKMCRIFSDAVKAVTEAKTFRKKMTLLESG